MCLKCISCNESFVFLFSGFGRVVGFHHGIDRVGFGWFDEVGPTDNSDVTMQLIGGADGKLSAASNVGSVKKDVVVFLLDYHFVILRSSMVVVSQVFFQQWSFSSLGMLAKRVYILRQV